jgi:uridine kinase
MPPTLSFDEVIASVGRRPHLRLLAIDGLPLAGKTTLADRLAAAIGGACVFLDDWTSPRGVEG